MPGTNSSASPCDSEYCCDSKDCRVSEKPERFGRHSIVKTSCNPPHQYHLACIPENLFRREQRNCSICDQPLLQLSRNGKPLVIDASESADQYALEKIFRCNPDILDIYQYLNKIDELCKAAFSGNATELKELILKTEADIINKKNERDGKMALHHAAEGGSVECVQILLVNGAEINTVDRDGNTPLQIAARGGQKECLELLIQRGADITVQNKAGETPRVSAAKEGKFACCELLDQKLTVKKLCTAVMEGNIAEFKRTITKVANIADTDENGKTVLDYATLNAISKKDKTCLDELCKNHADKISPKNASATLRIVIDAEEKHSLAQNITDILVGRINIEDQDESDGKTLLHYAAEKGSSYYLKKFLTEKQNSAIAIFIKDNKGRTPLHYAALEGKLNGIDELKKHKKLFMKIIDEKDKHENTALLLAAKNSHKTCVERLIKAKADVNIKNRSGLTLLHLIASSSNKTDGLDIDMYNFSSKDILEVDNRGNTPLHHAAFYGNGEFMKKIHRKFKKEFEACLKAENSDLCTPIHLAMQGRVMKSVRQQTSAHKKQMQAILS
nr:ankyrin repeat domain-containing protein [Endozoicomonas sp. ONNA2]